MKKYIIHAIVGLLAVLNINAASVKLAWNPNPETNIVSYTLAHKASGDSQYILTTVNHPATTITVSNLQDGVLYFFKVLATNSVGMNSEYSREISYQIPITQDPIVSIDSSKWKASAINSPESVMNAIDGDPLTFWETVGVSPLPQSFVLDLGSIVLVNGIGYLPRQGADIQDGRIRNFVIQTSMDGVVWTAAASGEFSNNAQEKLVVFTERHASFIKLTANTDWATGVNGLAAISELKVVGSYVIAPTVPINLKITP